MKYASVCLAIKANRIARDNVPSDFLDLEDDSGGSQPYKGDVKALLLFLQAENCLLEYTPEQIRNVLYLTHTELAAYWDDIPLTDVQFCFTIQTELPNAI